MANSEASLLIRIKKVGGETLDSVKAGLASIAGVAAAAGAAVVAYAVASVKAFKEQESATNALNKAMVQQGIYTPQLAKAYDDMAKSLQKVSIFGDETITKAQAQLQSYLGQIPITENLMKATLDLAQAQGIDLVSAANLVGKSIGTNTNALNRQGIEIDVNASKTEKLAAVTEGLNNKFGGQAEAATKGLGALDQMSNAVGDISELFGEALAPMVTLAAGYIRDLAVSMTENTAVIDGFKTGLWAVGSVFSVLKNLTLGWWEVLGGVLGPALQAISYLVQGEFTKAGEAVSLGMDDLQATMIERKNTLFAELDAIDAATSESDAAKREQEAINLKASEDRKNKIVLDAQAKLTADKITGKLAEDAKIFGLEKKKTETMAEFQARVDAERLAAQNKTLNAISSLQNSKNKELAMIGKAAAITQIAIDTPPTVASAFKWGTSIAGPVFGGIMAGIAGVAMAAQAAQIAGVQLAAGGIVSATQGGTPAILGEAGRDEAVVPLDGSAGGFGSTINITVMGGMLGDPQSAKEFARAVDHELFNLRKNNESVAFDSGVA